MLVALSVLWGCTAFKAAEELKIFIWSEYMDEENMPQDFEKATGIKVRLDFYESNEEMMAKLQAGGVAKYDIIVPSDYFLPGLISLKLIQPLDHSRIPNLKNLGVKFKAATSDPGNTYSAGWQWGTVGLMYRRNRIKGPDAQSWSIIFDSQKDPGSFVLIDSMREMMGIALLYLGYDFNSVNPRELEAASDLLIQTKKRTICLGFKGGVGGKNDVVAGTANAAIVPAKAPNPDAAHKWINWILDPKVNASLSNYNHFATPNEAAMPYLNKEDLYNPGVWPPPEIMEILYFAKDLGQDNRLMDEAWIRAKSQR